MSASSESAVLPPIFSFSMLRSNQREVKNRAKSEVVHVTENGNAAYVFCSEEVFEREKARAVEEALCDMQIAQLIEQGRDDVKSKRVVGGLDNAKQRMLAAWGRNG